MKNFKLLMIGLLLGSSFTMFAQQTVKGIVKEKSSGETLPGVSILVKGSNNGTETDFDGKFQIDNIKTGDVLVLTYLGYTTKEIAINTNFNLTIELKESSEQLNEIVVVGYGTTTIKDATGSVEAITAKDFTKGNIVTPENLLSGRVAGVNITSSGAPGSGSQITIRGGSSIGASNSPLIVIDGLPITNNGTAGTRGILSSINPADIESFSILKDASSTAIYGSRASNGVIIIVTKKGKKEYTLDYDFQYGAGEVVDRIDVFSADEFRNLVNSQPLSGSTLDASLLGTANTDWQDEVLQNTVSTQHNLTAKGQIFKSIPTRMSVGFTEQQGGILTSEFSRANFSVAMNPSLFKDHLKISLNYNRAFTNSRYAAGGIGGALRYDPTQPVRAGGPFGGFYQHYSGNASNFVLANGGTNPVANLIQNNNTGKSFRHYGNLNFDYKFHFLPELKFVANFGFDRTEGEYISKSSNSVPRSYNTVVFGNDANGFQNRENKLLDTYFNYTKQFKSIKTDITAGYSYQEFTGDGFNSSNLRDPNTSSDIYSNTPEVLIGFFGRANFTFLEKYLLTLSYRRDGTSKFSSDNRWGNFPAAAAAWRISDEDFLKDSNVISNLKLRASYGITGQQEISNPGIYLSTYRFGLSNSQFLFGNQIIQSTIPQPTNPDIKWEETATAELGIDYGLWNNKFTGTLGVFQKKSKDLLFSSPLADGTNFTNNIIQNIGELQIRGVEFTLNTELLNSEDFNWNVNFNATYLDREITSLPLGRDQQVGGISGGTGSTIQIHREGFSPSSFYVYKQLYDTAGKPIEGAYADINGDGIVNASDRYIKDNGVPDVTLGFQSSFTYKNLDFAFNLRASIGNYAYNNVNSSTAQYSLLQDQSVLGNIPTTSLDYGFRNTADVISSDIYLENASFLKMDNITIGYTFNPLLKKFKSNSIRLWAGVQNVFTITNYSGLDPEIFNNGIDNLIFPRSRTFLLGVNVKF
jgi:iron complex outermembrane receptor protein